MNINSQPGSKPATLASKVRTFTEKAEDIVFLSIDRDTGVYTFESSPADRKTEVNPVGHYVCFSLTIKQFTSLKKRLQKRPYLIEKYLRLD